MELSKRVQVYLFSSSIFERLPTLPNSFSRIVWILQSLWQAVWLGILEGETLNQITWAYYMNKSGFDDEEFNVHQGLWPWEAEAVRNHFANCQTILIAGAGGGREVIALAKLGHQVTAFDFSSHLVAACQRNLEKTGFQACVFNAPPDGVPVGLGEYDALLIGRGFYHHIPGRARRVNFLENCLNHLKPGAPILLSDFFTRPDDSLFYHRTERIANFVRRIRNCHERVELGDWLTNCMQHAFTQEEIQQELFDAGISLNDFAISPFSKDSHLAHAVGSIPYERQ